MKLKKAFSIDLPKIYVFEDQIVPAEATQEVTVYFEGSNLDSNLLCVLKLDDETEIESQLVIGAIYSDHRASCVLIGTSFFNQKKASL